MNEATLLHGWKNADVIPWTGSNRKNGETVDLVSRSGQKCKRKSPIVQKARLLHMQENVWLTGNVDKLYAAFHCGIREQIHLENCFIARNMKFAIAQTLADEVFVYEFSGSSGDIAAILSHSSHVLMRDDNGNTVNFCHAFSATVANAGAGGGKEKRVKSRMTEYVEGTAKDILRNEIRAMKDAIKEFRLANLAMNVTELQLEFFVFDGVDYIWNGFAPLPQIITDCKRQAKATGHTIEVKVRTRDGFYRLWHTDRKADTIS